jgi:hypothetical protein
LETANRLTELLALKEIRHSNIKSTLSKTNHLSSDTNATLVENLNGIFVALADFTENILLGDLDIVKVKNASRRSADTKL